MNNLTYLDQQILEHLQANGQSHPFSSLALRRLATECLHLGKMKDPCRLLDARMKLLRDAGQLAYKRVGKRYVVYNEAIQ